MTKTTMHLPHQEAKAGKSEEVVHAKNHSRSSTDAQTVSKKNTTATKAKKKTKMRKIQGPQTRTTTAMLLLQPFLFYAYHETFFGVPLAFVFAGRFFQNAASSSIAIRFPQVFLAVLSSLCFLLDT